MLSIIIESQGRALRIAQGRALRLSLLQEFHPSEPSLENKIEKFIDVY